MMQQDEDYLLGPWLAYHGDLFGLHNLYVLDNGSKSGKTVDTLAEYERRGTQINRSFSAREDYARKGEIIGSVIQWLDSTGTFDFLLPFDCDEFLVLRTPWGYTCQRASILAYLERLRGETRALRIPYQLANNPYEENLYSYFAFSKTFFGRSSFEYLDHGYHLGRTRGNAGIREVDLVHVHFHYPPYSQLVKRAQRKWTSSIPPEKALEHPLYKGHSIHLIPYFSMREDKYKARSESSVQFYMPALLDHLSKLGEPLLVPRDANGTESESCPPRSLRDAFDIDPSDGIDVGSFTRTPMFVPPNVGSNQWVKVYLEEEDYLRKNPDVRAAAVRALCHFCFYGYREPARVRALSGD
jgi:hypothetical protein